MKGYDYDGTKTAKQFVEESAKNSSQETQQETQTRDKGAIVKDGNGTNSSNISPKKKKSFLEKKLKDPSFFYDLLMSPKGLIKRSDLYVEKDLLTYGFLGLRPKITTVYTGGIERFKKDRKELQRLIYNQLKNIDKTLEILSDGNEEGYKALVILNNIATLDPVTQLDDLIENYIKLNSSEVRDTLRGVLRELIPEDDIPKINLFIPNKQVTHQDIDKKGRKIGPAPSTLKDIIEASLVRDYHRIIRVEEFNEDVLTGWNLKNEKLVPPKIACQTLKKTIYDLNKDVKEKEEALKLYNDIKLYIATSIFTEEKEKKGINQSTTYMRLLSGRLTLDIQGVSHLPFEESKNRAEEIILGNKLIRTQLGISIFKARHIEDLRGIEHFTLKDMVGDPNSDIPDLTYFQKDGIDRYARKDNQTEFDKEMERHNKLFAEWKRSYDADNSFYSNSSPQIEEGMKKLGKFYFSILKDIRKEKFKLSPKEKELLDVKPLEATFMPFTFLFGAVIDLNPELLNNYDKQKEIVNQELTDLKEEIKYFTDLADRSQ